MSKPHLDTVVNGRRVHVSRRRGYVEALVYAGEKPAPGEEPIAEWELPNQLRTALEEAARLAEGQTDR